jgi:ATP-dependent DNA ligase
MIKVKHERTCDCVVAGFRWHKGSNGTAIGSLLLGLYNDDGHLEHVGVSASFTTAKRRELVEFLAPYRENALEAHPWRAWAEGGVAEDGAQHRMPGGLSRWSQGKDLSWEPLRPELVVEVAYDHMQGSRFRHTAHFRRWRSDNGRARLYVRATRGGSAARVGRDLSGACRVILSAAPAAGHPEAACGSS